MGQRAARRGPSRTVVFRTAFAIAALLLAGVGCVRPLEAASATTEVATGESGPYDPHAATRFGPGDMFEVRVIGEPDLSGPYRIAPDGTLDFPYCGRLHVDGLITSEVASRLTHCLKNGYLKIPQVVVVGREIGANRKVFIFGYVQKAGPYPYLDNMSIVEVVAQAGGFSTYAGQNQVSVIRTGPDGHDQKFKVPVQDIGMGKAPNFLLRPGDIVYVPESAF